MNEDDYLECLHFNSLHRGGKLYNQSVPIVLSCTDADRQSIVGGSGTTPRGVSLVYEGKRVAVMRNVSVYPHRKEERCARQFGLNNNGHPYQRYINEECGDWLIGGDLLVFERIRWHDGLDDYRLTPRELEQRFKDIKVQHITSFIKGSSQK